MNNNLNRLHNASNPWQGKYKKVLCICSAGLLRSPTVAFILSQEPYNYNTRAVGMDDSFALILIDEILIQWADELVVMKYSQAIEIKDKFKTEKPICILDINDNFSYRDPELMELIKEKYGKNYLTK